MSRPVRGRCPVHAGRRTYRRHRDALQVAEHVRNGCRRQGVTPPDLVIVRCDHARGFHLRDLDDDAEYRELQPAS